MSSINSLSGSLGGSASGNAFSELNSEEFIKIMFTELSQQDPLEPSDSKDLLQQLSSLRSIQSDMDMGLRLQSLVIQNELSAASGLIGRNVSGLTDTYERVQGIVTSVYHTQYGAVLQLRSGERIAMPNLDQVLEQPEEPEPPEEET